MYPRITTLSSLVHNNILLWIAFYRMAGLFVLRTSFVPDEYFQTLEPAFAIIYGEGAGHSSWEWQVEHRIRSYVPILPFIAAYKFLRIVNLDQYLEMTVLLPRALQTVLTIASDISLFRLSRALFGPSVAGYALSVHMLSWFLSYCASRSMANTTEASLVILGAAYILPDNAVDMHYAMGLFIAAISTYCRPTCACIWVTVVGFKLCTAKSFRKFFISNCVPIGLAVLEFCVAVDSTCYGGILTFSPWNFFRVNIALNYAAKFGVNTWHWNFTHGLPVILGFYFPLLLYDLFAAEKKQFSRRWLMVAVPAVYATGLAIASPHQEYRFLLPCLPFIHMFLGGTVQRIASRGRVWQCALLAAALCQVLAAGFLLRYHQSGVERAFLFIGQDLRRGYAYIYSPRYPLRLHLAPCLPGEPSAYFDADPSAYLRSMIAAAGGVRAYEIQYIVTFDAYYSSEHFLNTTRDLGFQKAAYFQHAYFRYDYDDPLPKYAAIVLRRIAALS